MLKWLTYKEWYVLNKIVSISDENFQWNTIDDDTLFDEVFKVVFSKSDLDSILDRLNNKNYFVNNEYTVYLNGGRAFRLTYDGKHYKNVCLGRIIKFIITSIIIPIITSIITVWIKA